MAEPLAHTSTSTALLAPPAAAFRFVSRLAEELSQGRLELPALPEVVGRIKQALSDEDVAPAVVSRLVATEPGLAARVMMLANSTIMNPSGARITELRSAVTRIGFRNVRATSIAYAIAKMRQASDVNGIRSEMQTLWREALAVASLSYAVARRSGRVNADEALLAGLVHNIGKVYILSRAHRYVQLFVSVEDTANIMRDWHANVGKAIVESWGFAPHLVQAINEHEDPYRDIKTADLADVLYVAVHLQPALSVQMPTDMSWQEPELLHESEALPRLGLDTPSLRRVILDGAQALHDLKSALGP
jgi:HD-like signal output (HDOD) protein